MVSTFRGTGLSAYPCIQNYVLFDILEAFYRLHHMAVSAILFSVLWSSMAAERLTLCGHNSPGPNWDWKCLNFIGMAIGAFKGQSWRWWWPVWKGLNDIESVNWMRGYCIEPGDDASLSTGLSNAWPNLGRSAAGFSAALTCRPNYKAVWTH